MPPSIMACWLLVKPLARLLPMPPRRPSPRRPSQEASPLKRELSNIFPLPHPAECAEVPAADGAVGAERRPADARAAEDRLQQRGLLDRGRGRARLPELPRAG